MGAKETIEQSLIKNTSQKVSEADKEDFIIFQAAAKKFLNQIEELSKKEYSQVSKSTIKQNITKLYQEMRENTEYTRAIIQYQHEFEVALDNFLGRTIYLTYVVPEGDLYFYGSANIGELYKTATAQKGRANIAESKMFEANDLQAKIKEDIKRSIANKKKVYQEALSRYDKDKKEEYMHYNPSEKTFYWWAQYHKKLGGWTDRISNKGPIAEGYAGAVINQDPEINNNNLEHSLEKLWLNHIKKDSIGAAIKGDVVLDSNGNIQFAIKSGSFSTARIRQYLGLAYNVLQLKNLSAKELISNPRLFYKLSSGGFSQMAETIVEALNNNIVGEELNKIIWQK